MERENPMKKLLALILCACLACALLPVHAEDNGFPVTVTDAAGRAVTIEKQPESIVSGYYIATSMLIALGLEDKLVGVEAKAASRPIYGLAAPRVLDLPSVGTAKQFDLEGALALSPDLVVLPLRLKEAALTLESMGVTAILVNPENWDLLLDTARLLEDACGISDDVLLSYYESKEKALSFLLKDTEKPLVYLAGNSNYLTTAGAAMYQDTMLTMGGGANVAADLPDVYWTEISYEQLLLWDPQVIIIAADAAYTAEDLLSDENLKDLQAVKNGAVYAMPTYPEAWDSPVPAAILGSLWVACTLHGDVYPAQDFYADVETFYDTFYGFKVTEEMLTR